MAGDVGNRLASDAAREQRFVTLGKTRRLPFSGADQEPFGGPAEHVLRQQSRVEVGFGGRHSRVAQALPRGGDTRLNVHDTAVASFSFSDW